MRISLPESLASYRGVIFDLDGTLVDLPVDWSALRNALQAHWTTLGLDSTHGVREGLNAIERRTGRNGLESSFEIIRQFEARSVPAAKLHDETIEAVQACADRGQKLAIFTSNMADTAKDSLAFLDLLDAFGPVVGGDCVRNRKPHPEGLRAILSEWRLSSNEVAYVADGEHEAQMASELGIQIFRAA